MSIFQFSLSHDVDTDICIFGIYQEHHINKKPFYNTVHVEGIDRQGGFEMNEIREALHTALKEFFPEIKKIGEYVFEVETTHTENIPLLSKVCSLFIHHLEPLKYYFIDGV